MFKRLFRVGDSRRLDLNKSFLRPLQRIRDLTFLSCGAITERLLQQRLCNQSLNKHGVQRRMIYAVIFFFRIFEIIIFCFVVAICDLVHDVETISHLSYMLTASGNLF